MRRWGPYSQVALSLLGEICVGIECHEGSSSHIQRRGCIGGERDYFRLLGTRKASCRGLQSSWALKER